MCHAVIHVSELIEAVMCLVSQGDLQVLCFAALAAVQRVSAKVAIDSAIRLIALEAVGRLCVGHFDDLG